MVSASWWWFSINAFSTFHTALDCKAYVVMPCRRTLEVWTMAKNTAGKTRSNSRKRRNESKKISNAAYEKALACQQIELVKLQEWVKHTGHRVAILFEGRDAAGKGGTIKRITESLNPRICQVVALPAPTEREKTQWYSNAMCPTCQPPVRSSYSTGPGTIAPVLSTLWGFAPMRSTGSSCAVVQSLSAC